MEKMNEKKKRFRSLFLTGKYTQQEIADQIGVSRVSISQWTRDFPATHYMRIKRNLIKELERLSQKPAGHEDLIFRYIEYIDLLDRMIRKAKYLPEP